MKIDFKNELTEDEIQEIINGLKKRVEPEEKEEYKPKAINQKIAESLELLRSCTFPNVNELAVVTDVTIKRNHNSFSIKYPVVIREEKEPLDVNYLVDGMMKTTGNDFKTLKMSASSMLVGQRVLESVRIKYDKEAKFFLEKRLESSNSSNSLAMSLGYELLAPTKVEKVEETDKLDDKGKRIFKVYSLDFRGKYDPLIIGAGLSVCIYAGINSRIEIVH